MSTKRVKFLVFFLIGFFLVLTGRLVYLQIIKGEYYRGLSTKNHLKFFISIPPRGKIYDRNGILLAYDKPVYNLYVFPYDVKQGARTKKEKMEKVEDLAFRLEKFLGIKLSEKIKNKILKGYAKKIVIYRGLDKKQIETIYSYPLQLRDIHIEVRPKRIYTEHTKYLPHLIGFVGYPSKKDLRENPHLPPDMFIGKQGIEKMYNDYLTGQFGVKMVMVDAFGRTKKVLLDIPPKRGKDIYLTVDTKIQKIVYESFEKSKQKSGAVIIVDPNSYEIIALMSYPIYDLQKFVKGFTKEEWKKLIENKYKPLFNKALGGLYPPGSIFKIIVAAAALQEGIIEPDTKIESKGFIQIGKWKYRNWDLSGCGKIDVKRALEMSCDTFFYQVGIKLGSMRIAEYSHLFGLGEKLNPRIERRVSRIPTPEWKKRYIGESWYLGDTVNYSIGQGFLAITPFDSVKIIAPIANGGFVYKPHLLKAYFDTDKNKLVEIKPELIRSLNIRREYINAIRKGLYLVVYGKRATAKDLKDAPVKNAGKTGTAQVYRHEEHNVKIDKWELQNHAWFVDFAPYKDPKYVISVFVEHGIGGSKTAVPITKEIINRLYEEGYFEKN
jgi:penicillin-binding protein 2